MYNLCKFAFSVKKTVFRYLVLVELSDGNTNRPPCFNLFPLQNLLFLYFLLFLFTFTVEKREDMHKTCRQTLAKIGKHYILRTSLLTETKILSEFKPGRGKP